MIRAILDYARDTIVGEKTVTTKEGVTYTIVTVRPSQKAYGKAVEAELKVAFAAETARREAERAYEETVNNSRCCRGGIYNKKS